METIRSGKYVLVNKIPFQVIGVMAEMGATSFGNDQDDVVLVPLTTGSMRLFGQRNVRTITVQVKDAAAIDITQQTIQALLDQRHKREDTQITNMSSVREAFTETSNTMKLFLGSVAAISLLVGGIGVMNIMLVTCQRAHPRDRRAHGNGRAPARHPPAVHHRGAGRLGDRRHARRRPRSRRPERSPASSACPFRSRSAPSALAFACAFLTGLVFGFLPARNASRLQPAVALSAD